MRSVLLVECMIGCLKNTITVFFKVCFMTTYRVSKKTEFCQIEHLQILLVIGEKYLMIFVANPVVSCFESAISMLLLGAL